MTDNTEDFKDDELIIIKLPRKKYEILNNMIEREQAYNWFTSALKSSWLWIVGGGILTLIMLYDRFNGVIK